MKHIAAIVVLATGLSGCGSSETSWQDEVREESRRDFELVANPERIRTWCDDMEEDGAIEMAMSASVEEMQDSDLVIYSSGRELSEILADHGVTLTPEILGEVAEITFEEIARNCDWSSERSWGSSESGWQDELREQVRYEFNNPPTGEAMADYLAVCGLMNSEERREEIRLGLISDFDSIFNDVRDYSGSGKIRTVDEILNDYGIERTAAISSEVVDVFLDEAESLCS